MLGSSALFIPGLVVMAVGFTLQAGATGAVKAVKLSAHLVGRRREHRGCAGGRPATPGSRRETSRASGGVRRGARCAGRLCVMRTSIAPIFGTW
jgi:hypothetical protein